VSDYTPDCTAEELIRVNSHELTAHLLVRARRELAEERREQERLMRRWEAGLALTHKIGMRVLAADRAGRKMVKVAELLGDVE
jgi:hypothetical protein